MKKCTDLGKNDVPSVHLEYPNKCKTKKNVKIMLPPTLK